MGEIGNNKRITTTSTPSSEDCRLSMMAQTKDDDNKANDDIKHLEDDLCEKLEVGDGIQSATILVDEKGGHGTTTTTMGKQQDDHDYIKHQDNLCEKLQGVQSNSTAWRPTTTSNNNGDGNDNNTMPVDHDIMDLPTFSRQNQVQRNAIPQVGAIATGGTQLQPGQAEMLSRNHADDHSSTKSGFSELLAEALPVLEDENQDHHQRQVAVPWGDQPPEAAAAGSGEGGAAEATAANATGERKQGTRLLGSGGIFVLGLIGVSLVVLLVIFLTADTSSNSNPATTPSTIPSTPTMPPTLPPLGSDLLQVLPQSTIQSLNTIDSPQQKAWNWLLNDTHIHEYSVERKLQRFALSTLYYATDGDSWMNNTNWLSYEQHECNWYQQSLPTFVLFEDPTTRPHVRQVLGSSRCSSKSDEEMLVQHLWLDQNGLNGNLPPEIYLLTSLQTLELSLNALGGSIPTIIGNLRDLEFLALVWTQTTGTIPTEIIQCTNLQMLGFLYNQLSGTIPIEIMSNQLTDLWGLYLDNNILTGTISTDIGRMTQLEALTLQENPLLSGTLPSELGLLHQLELLVLGSSPITGTIPTEMGLMTNMKSMAITNAALSGTLPHQLGNPQLLQILLLGNNMLMGTIPSSLGQLELLYSVSFQSNQLTGNIQTELGQISFFGDTNATSWTQYVRARYGIAIGGMSFHNNSLSGRIPSELGQSSGMGWLTLSDNQLTGSLPSELGLLSLMDGFDISKNALTGTIPEEMNSWPFHNNSYAFGNPWSIAGNNFVGTIPANLCRQAHTSPLLFDCSEELCGCSCECFGRSNSTTNSSEIGI